MIVFLHLQLATESYIHSHTHTHTHTHLHFTLVVRQGAGLSRQPQIAPEKEKKVRKTHFQTNQLSNNLTKHGQQNSYIKGHFSHKNTLINEDTSVKSSIYTHVHTCTCIYISHPPIQGHFQLLLHISFMNYAKSAHCS